MLNVSISNRSTKNKERGLSCEVNGHGIHVIPPTSDGRSVQTANRHFLKVIVFVPVLAVVF